VQWLYFDASALVKRYSQETGTSLINELFRRSALNLRQHLQETGDTLILSASDKRLVRAAQMEQIDVFDPEQETAERLSALRARFPSPVRRR